MEGNVPFLFRDCIDYLVIISLCFVVGEFELVL